jgi:hypothetical protein
MIDKLKVCEKKQFTLEYQTEGSKLKDFKDLYKTIEKIWRRLANAKQDCIIELRHVWFLQCAKCKGECQRILVDIVRSLEFEIQE